MYKSKAHTNSPFPHPISINLLNNYPNPFNPSTTISFHIDKPNIIDIHEWF